MSFISTWSKCMIVTLPLERMTTMILACLRKTNLYSHEQKIKQNAHFVCPQLRGADSPVLNMLSTDENRKWFTFATEIYSNRNTIFRCGRPTLISLCFQSILWDIYKSFVLFCTDSCRLSSSIINMPWTTSILRYTFAPKAQKNTCQWILLKTWTKEEATRKMFSLRHPLGWIAS